MKRYNLLFFAVFVFSVIASNCFGQYAGWTSYNYGGKNIRAIADSGNELWIGTVGGLVKMNKTTGEMMFYNISNSGLPDNRVRALAIEGTTGDIWIGTEGGGLAKFDRTNWTVLNTSNSGLSSNKVDALVMEESNIWICTLDNGGLVKFDGTNWTVYDTSNSGLPSALAVEGNNIWIGILQGVEEKSNIKNQILNIKTSQNPFAQSTAISYQIPAKSKVSLTLYDIAGSCVKTLVDGEKEAGSYSVKLMEKS
ncbi:MAG: hypothetical protein WC614_07455 [bacterium]